MPIEIGELEISTRIEGITESVSSNVEQQLTSEEIIQDAVERVLKILRRKTEL